MLNTENPDLSKITSESKQLSSYGQGMIYNVLNKLMIWAAASEPQTRYRVKDRHSRQIPN